MAKQHIFFAFDDENEQDLEVVRQLKDELRERNLRIYEPSPTEDVNQSIAKGVEGARLLLVFPSQSFQRSKTGSKVLNYADQRKKLVIKVQHLPHFQPTSWLGALLAPTQSSEPDIERILSTMISLGVDLKDLTMQEGEDLEQLMQTALFWGGEQMNNVSGYYVHEGSQFPIRFDFFCLQDGRIAGQGDDTVGAFTICGEYETSEFQFAFYKNYIEQHTVVYIGRLRFDGLDCYLEGNWDIDGYSDQFSLHLTLASPFESKKDKVERRGKGTKVLISYCAGQESLAQKIGTGLTSEGLETVCPDFDVNLMIRLIASDTAVVVPLMSQFYQDSTQARKVLSYADRVNVPIVPVKAQQQFNQSDWLGLICAGALWTEITPDTTEFEQKIKDLKAQVSAYLSESSETEGSHNVLFEGGTVTGYYKQGDEKVAMTLDFLALVDGKIMGQGDDPVGSFIITGQYDETTEIEISPLNFHFVKQYLGAHQVLYTGFAYAQGKWIILHGEWRIEDMVGEFQFQLERSGPIKPPGRHIMLSYQWNSQELVKKIADLLKSRGVKIWFDIAGDMKGNINAAMANGVEKAAAIVSFTSAAYQKSVNCQKELTYASQLKKNIIPVHLDTAHESDSWMAQIVTSLNSVNFNDQSQFDSVFQDLTTKIDAILSDTGDDDSSQNIPTLFEGGSVEGAYWHEGTAYPMAFSFFSLREGRVAGQGDDGIGSFTMAGTYDENGLVTFTKQYIGQHSVEYNGQLKSMIPSNTFEIEGTWLIDGMSDRFRLACAQ
eukprot:TRINITY_DN1086_c0_g1_i1.p1 TRINITY_DN1086_c0_g1~~TRINITY_DN1086_c0_g1_i1.p1  ORF type:complete len:784 (+),score=198.15 TRINITY_DN1086_c0_g1_i1:33-2354(+)